MSESNPLPALGRPAFSCPYCGAYTSHIWYGMRAMGTKREELPSVPAADDMESPADYPGISEERFNELRPRMIEWRDKMRSGIPFLETASKDSWAKGDVPNLFLSECYVCDRLAVWLGEALLLPASRGGEAPHVDLPLGIVPDFEEARAIVNLSPRGAAALLRLAIQKLCKDLGEPGKDLNIDIGSLVAKGLPTQIQQALDAVRVVGNEAVHPGELNLKDDRDTAEHLFELVNMIVEDRISRPKALASLYGRLPKAKLDGIERRDAKT